MTRDEVKEGIIEIIAKDLCVDKTKITEEKKLEDDLGADSLDHIELMMNAEDKFDVYIDEDSKEVEEITTVKQFIDHVFKLVSTKK